MQGAILIFGGNKKERLQKIEGVVADLSVRLEKENNPDLLKITPEKGKSSIGIEKARQIIKFLSQKPYESDTKLVIIEDAHLLNKQTQNALLKSLEELPKYATVILECPDKKNLLETVISRCQLIQLSGKAQKGSDAPSWEKIKKLPISAKLDLAEKIAKKERLEAIAILENWINCELELMRKSTKTEEMRQQKENLQLLAEVKEDLKATNVNLALGMDNLLVHLQ